MGEARSGVVRIIHDEQDAAPLMAVLHANYAAAYMYAMLDIATDSQIHNMTGVDMKKFKEHVTNVQDMVTKKTVDFDPPVVALGTKLRWASLFVFLLSLFSLYFVSSPKQIKTA